MRTYPKGAFLSFVLAGSATLASASGISYTCDPSIAADGPAGFCASIGSTVGNDYNSIFSNANASIYIEFANNNGLADSTSGFLNLVSYGTYQTALAAHSSGNVVDTAAVASLAGSEPASFRGGSIELTSALEQALGISGGFGTTATGAPCTTPGVGGCYNGIIQLNIPADLSAETGGQGYYFGTGTQTSNEYDIFSIIEHETDEVLGTSSCIDTGGGALTDGCAGVFNASAVDLFRYQSDGTRVVQSQTPGAYFSYDGGVTQTGPAYNTLANGDDYADFATNCSNVQDATGCLGSKQDISTDGGAEVNILDTIGYNLNPPVASPVPEPSSFALLGSGLLGIAGMVRRRRSAAV